MSEKQIENMIIIGGGPAGYTAALYAARAELEPLVIEGFQWGGQLQNTTDVENYPGYPEGIMGPEMMQQFRAQAERFGARLVTDDVDRVELTDGGIHKVFLGERSTSRSTVVLGMGAEPKRLGVPGEIELGGRGVSTCGVCDGAFFKDEEVVVIGGGDSAMEDSIFISKFANELTVITRREEFRASKIMFERAEEQPNISFMTPFVPEEFVAGEDGKLDHVRLRNTETGETEEMKTDGAFVAIGHIPKSEIVQGQVDTDEDGYVITEGGSTKPTSPVSSRSATSSTTPTGRRSPPPAPAAWAPSTPSGTCATRRPRPRRTGSGAASRSRSRHGVPAPNRRTFASLDLWTGAPGHSPSRSPRSGEPRTCSSRSRCATCRRRWSPGRGSRRVRWCSLR